MTSVTPDAGGGNGRPSISPGEQQVLRLSAQGSSTPQIAHALYRSPGSIHIYLRRLMVKLGASDRTELVDKARAAGLL